MVQDSSFDVLIRVETIGMIGNRIYKTTQSLPFEHPRSCFVFRCSLHKQATAIPRCTKAQKAAATLPGKQGNSHGHCLEASDSPLVFVQLPFSHSLCRRRSQIHHWLHQHRSRLFRVQWCGRHIASKLKHIDTRKDELKFHQFPPGFRSAVSVSPALNFQRIRRLPLVAPR